MRTGVPAGVAGHAPEAHLWVNGLDVADFHAVCFFNCGSLHDGKGERFRLRDMAPAIDAMREIRKPCIGYKIMGAGRIDARMAFEYAFENIKPATWSTWACTAATRTTWWRRTRRLVREILAAACSPQLCRSSCGRSLSC